MRLRLDLCDVDLQFKINGWREPKTGEDGCDKWCNVELSLKSKYIDYKPSGELIMSSEVVWIKDVLKKLIDNELEEDYTITLAEPDIQFEFRIAKRFFSTPGIVYYAKGYEDVDINGDWIIHFWCNDGALGGNSLSMTLDRNDITNLYNYIMLVTGEIKSDSQVIMDMLKKGTMLPE